MQQYDRIAQQRVNKLAELKALGVSPYPYGYHRTHTVQEAINLLHEDDDIVQNEALIVNVAGRIMASRSMGKASFLDLRDGSGKIQLLMRQNVIGEDKYQFFQKEIDIGDILGATGRVMHSRTGEPTIEVQNFTLLAKSLQPLPEKFHGLTDVDKRFRQRYLDLIANPEVRETFRQRSQIVMAVRQFLINRGFLEVETPVLQPEAGGAAARPFITHHNALDRDFYLRIALELHLKRLIVGGFDKVFEIGRTFS